MREEAVLITLSELDRWKRREKEVEAELAKIRRQVAYYEALAKEMKKEMHPVSVKDLLRSMRRTF
ncbi:MAG TPA: hypothetical protein VNZ52_15930 [Candidatus Thermoplasmatota archaeon]|nr:hypothetical protein [Candidatus Thermoplasmatota archaeon]